MDEKRVGAVVQRLRQANDWRLEDLARRADLSTSYLSRLELSQVQSPKIGELRKLAGAFGVTVAYLIGDDEGAQAAALDELLGDPEAALRLIRRSRVPDRAAIPEDVRRDVLATIDRLLDLLYGAEAPERERQLGLNGAPDQTL